MNYDCSNTNKQTEQVTGEMSELYSVNWSRWIDNDKMKCDSLWFYISTESQCHRYNDISIQQTSKDRLEMLYSILSIFDIQNMGFSRINNLRFELGRSNKQRKIFFFIEPINIIEAIPISSAFHATQKNSYDKMRFITRIMPLFSFSLALSLLFIRLDLSFGDRSI